MIYALDTIPATAIGYLPRLHTGGRIIYLSVLVFLAAVFASLPFVYVDISVKAAGITRPASERTEIRSLVPGIIDSLLYREGERVEKNAVILRIRDPATPGKKTRSLFEITQREAFIHDLVLLTAGTPVSLQLLLQLCSPLYKEQAGRFIHQKTDQEASLKKANKELEIYTSLAKDKVISAKEFFDSQVNQEKADALYHAFAQEQLSLWQQDLARFRLELSQYRQEMQQTVSEAAYYQVKAPVAGIIQGIHTRYSGGSLQANEVICNISPEEILIGECYVPAKDIGLLRTGQIARYQFEAFNYNDFGIITGRILGIDNDFTAVDNKPFFKLRCSFDADKLSLANGFTARLKKGLGFQASFLVTRRSLWQLLFDKLDDWLNPAAPAKNRAAAR